MLHKPIKKKLKTVFSTGNFKMGLAAPQEEQLVPSIKSQYKRHSKTV